jgi:orotidine-5'-phosphate decarboxylase
MHGHEANIRKQAGAQGRVILALDVATDSEARGLITSMHGQITTFKVGLELIHSVGLSMVQEVKAAGMACLLDGKFNDIPNTVAGASRAAARLGANMFTVHAMGGTEMMRAAVDAVSDEAHHGALRPAVLGVTILTSIDSTVMNSELRIPGSVKEQVAHLAQLAADSGVDGIVCSPWEIADVKASIRDDMIIVTPGVRPVWAKAADQKRFMTPHDAIQMGADYIVIGRPVIHPPAEIGPPARAAELVVKEVSEGLNERRRA